MSLTTNPSYLESQNLVDLLVCEGLRHGTGVVVPVPYILRALPVVWDVLVLQSERHLRQPQARSDPIRMHE